MRIMGVILSFLALQGASFALGEKASNGRQQFLVVMSGEDKITLNKDKSGTAEVTHGTGFFLSELMIPLQTLVDAGFEPVFITPQGTKPVMDAISNNAFWFGGNEKEYKYYRNRCLELGLCGEGRVGTLNTKSFSDVLQGGLKNYVAIFFPGGHAPMEDLYKNKELGTILKHFHKTRKPTALICHGPIALLSTLQNPEAFGASLEELNELSLSPAEHKEKIQTIQARLSELSKSWIYRGYKMTSFSTKEEEQEEPEGADNALGGYVKFYPDEALDVAGGKVLVRAQKWQSNVVQDRELITGQNPFSDKEFARTLLTSIRTYTKDRTNK